MFKCEARVLDCIESFNTLIGGLTRGIISLLYSHFLMNSFSTSGEKFLLLVFPLGGLLLSLHLRFSAFGCSLLVPHFSLENSYVDSFSHLNLT